MDTLSTQSLQHVKFLYMYPRRLCTNNPPIFSCISVVTFMASIHRNAAQSPIVYNLRSYSIMVSPNCYITMRSPSSLGLDISPLHFVDHYHELVTCCPPIEATSPSHELVPPEVIMIRCQRSLSFVFSSSSYLIKVLQSSSQVLCGCFVTVKSTLCH